MTTQEGAFLRRAATDKLLDDQISRCAQQTEHNAAIVAQLLSAVAPYFDDKALLPTGAECAVALFQNVLALVAAVVACHAPARDPDKMLSVLPGIAVGMFTLMMGVRLDKPEHMQHYCAVCLTMHFAAGTKLPECNNEVARQALLTHFGYVPGSARTVGVFMPDNIATAEDHVANALQALFTDAGVLPVTSVQTTPMILCSACHKLTSLPKTGAIRTALKETMHNRRLFVVQLAAEVYLMLLSLLRRAHSVPVRLPMPLFGMDKKLKQGSTWIVQEMQGNFFMKMFMHHYSVFITGPDTIARAQSIPAMFANAIADILRVYAPVPASYAPAPFNPDLAQLNMTEHNLGRLFKAAPRARRTIPKYIEEATRCVHVMIDEIGLPDDRSRLTFADISGALLERAKSIEYEGLQSRVQLAIAVAGHDTAPEPDALRGIADLNELLTCPSPTTDGEPDDGAPADTERSPEQIKCDTLACYVYIGLLRALRGEFADAGIKLALLRYLVCAAERIGDAHTVPPQDIVSGIPAQVRDTAQDLVKDHPCEVAMSLVPALYDLHLVHCLKEMVRGDGDALRANAAMHWLAIVHRVMEIGAEIVPSQCKTMRAVAASLVESSLTNMFVFRAGTFPTTTPDIIQRIDRAEACDHLVMDLVTALVNSSSTAPRDLLSAAFIGRGLGVRSALQSDSERMLRINFGDCGTLMAVERADLAAPTTCDVTLVREKTKELVASVLTRELPVPLLPRGTESAPDAYKMLQSYMVELACAHGGLRSRQLRAVQAITTAQACDGTPLFVPERLLPAHRIETFRDDDRLLSLATPGAWFASMRLDDVRNLSVGTLLSVVLSVPMMPYGMFAVPYVTLPTADHATVKRVCLDVGVWQTEGCTARALAFMSLLGTFLPLDTTNELVRGGCIPRAPSLADNLTLFADMRREQLQFAGAWRDLPVKFFRHVVTDANPARLMRAVQKWEQTLAQNLFGEMPSAELCFADAPCAIEAPAMPAKTFHHLLGENLALCGDNYAAAQSAATLLVAQGGDNADEIPINLLAMRAVLVCGGITEARTLRLALRFVSLKDNRFLFLPDWLQEHLAARRGPLAEDAPTMNPVQVVPSPVPVLSAIGPGFLSPRAMISPGSDILTNAAAHAVFMDMRRAPTPAMMHGGMVNMAAQTLLQCCDRCTTRLTGDMVAVMPKWEQRLLALCVISHGLGTGDIKMLQTIFPTLAALEEVLGTNFGPLRQFRTFLQTPTTEALAAAMAQQGLRAELAPDLMRSDELEATVAQMWDGLCVACVRWGGLAPEIIESKLHAFGRADYIHISEAHAAIMKYYHAVKGGVLQWSRDAFVAIQTAQMMRRSIASLHAIFPAPLPAGTPSTPSIPCGPAAKRARS